MVQLSVNVNKVATLRNARGGDVPNVCSAVEAILAAGATGITVHPRADERHIRRHDVGDLAKLLAPLRQTVEYNIEGDPRPDFLELVHAVRPHQCTLVPVLPGEITSQAGWSEATSPATLAAQIRDLKAAGIRVALFVEADAAAIRWAASLGADRVELYTEPFAKAFSAGHGPAAMDRYVAAAQVAADVGLGVNAGHDLDLDNLVLFRELPGLDEVSIGHALISRAVFVGLATVVREYLQVLA